jgi:hypothetical protein
MPDPAQQLQRLVEAGFELQSFERFPRSLGVVRGECIVLVEPTPEGLKMVGSAGWRMGEVLGVLVNRRGRLFFQAKAELIAATPERMELLRRFESDLQSLLNEEGTPTS